MKKTLLNQEEGQMGQLDAASPWAAKGKAAKGKDAGE